MDGEPAQAVWGYEWVSNPVIWEWGGARPRKQDGSIPAMPGQRSRKYFESFKFKGREGEGAMTPAGWFCRNVLILPAIISWLTGGNWIGGEDTISKLHTVMRKCID